MLNTTKKLWGGRMHRGSEWRRWDLHVHTASSGDYAYNEDDADEQLVNAWRQNNIDAVAITDHFLIDARRIEHLRELAPEIAIFPGVELRTDKGGNNIHVIGIFSDSTNLKELEEDFNAIMLRPNPNNGSFEKIYWDYEHIKRFIKDREGIISIHSGNKTQGMDKVIDNKSIFNVAIKEEYAESVDIFEHNNLHSCQGYIDHVFPKIGVRPLIVCSDNHNPTDYKFSNELWIKADTNFYGLNQAIQHPDERIFIGTEPPKLTHEKSETQYIIDSLKIQKKSDVSNPEIWFNTNLELNSALVTVIGNKGSGKSALSDILGLVGNSLNFDNNVASFLTDTRFNRAPKYFGKDYEAVLTWKDGHLDNADTLEISDNTEHPRIQYLPQKYIENVCSNLDDGFQNEINNVLYSYLDETEKLGTRSFEEFIIEKTKTINLSINSLKEQINNLNIRIIDLEGKKTASYITSLQTRSIELNEELKRHIAQQPVELQKPTDLQNNESTKQLETLEDDINKIQTDIKTITEYIQNLIKQKHEVETLKTKIIIELSKVNTINREIDQIIAPYIDDEIHNYQIVVDSPEPKFDELLQKISDLISMNNLKLNGNNEDSLVRQEKVLIELKEKIIEESDTEIKTYQKYIQELRVWQEKLDKIKDDKSSTNTISYIDSEINYVQTELENDYQTLVNQRKGLIAAVHDEKNKIVEMYKNIYSPIDTELRPILTELDNGITFTATLSVEDFSSAFLDQINKQHSSLFSGLDNSKIQMDNLLKKMDSMNFDSVYDFIEEVIKGCMSNDGSEDFDKMDKVIKDKIALYNKLCNLDYITTDYSLTLDAKDLSQLSPGERGLVLLIFYLVLSKDKLPIIIDQPEDNLDNQSIYSKLVPCIRKAKQTRQVFLVTHNPNIAVACDSEQIIVANIDKINNSISYESGSIENVKLNNRLVDILEGTLPAFDLRERKYIF